MIAAIYKIVELKYFESGDFNGMPIYGLVNNFDVNSDEFRKAVRKAISDEILEGRFHDNTHIALLCRLWNF